MPRSLTRLLAPLALAFIAATSLFAHPAAANAADYFKLSAHHDALVLDVEGGSTRAGAKVVQWYDNGGTNQHWTVPLYYNSALHTTSDGAIVNQRTGMCLTSDGVAGHQLFQYPCQTNALRDPVAGQNWRVENINADLVRSHSLQIVSTDFHLAVDVSNYSYAPGAAVVAWYPRGNAAFEYPLNQVFEQFRA